MAWQYVTPILLAVTLGILFFIWWKTLLNEQQNTIYIFFFVCNVQDYFEGLMWDLRRISNWRDRDVAVYVTDMGSNDDTVHIMQLLEDKGFLHKLTPRQSTNLLRSKSKNGVNNWIFHLKKDSDVKEIRKCFVKIFTEHVQPPQKQTELF